MSLLNHAPVIPQKRGPGRPRKYPLIEMTSTEPRRGPGRPRKNPIIIVGPSNRIIKRGRGRPRKNPLAEQQIISTAPPRPGRPQKQSLETAPPRKRGRPRKHPVVEVFQPQPAVQPPKSTDRIRIMPPVIKSEVLEAPLLSSMDLVRLGFVGFPQHTPYFKKLFENLQARQWYHISAIPQQVKDMGLNYPMLIPAASCWKSQMSPPLSDIFAYAVDNFGPGDVTIEASSEWEPTVRTAGNVFYQLIAPPPEKPMVAHNIPLEGHGALDPFCIPFPAILPPAGEIDYSMNVTPANTVVDIHIDQGTNGLSVGIGRPSDPSTLKVHKIWLLWPPTQHNLAQYERLCRTPGARLPRSSALEHGVVTSMGPESAIFLPAGWLHATITINGGFLCGITFNSKATIGMASQLMSIDCKVHPDSFNHLAPIYTAALEETLASDGSLPDLPTLRNAVIGWLEIERALKAINFKPARTRSGVVCRKLLEVWEQVFGSGISEVERVFKECPASACGWRAKGGRNGGTPFGRHFWDAHLKVVMPDRMKTPYEAAETGEVW